MASGNKVFISWSGSPSKEIANALHIWLNDVLDHVVPWVSDIDIEAGSRGIAEIEDSLRDARAGIIIVTKATMEKPWVNFEAGALAKVVGDDPKNRVIPLLVGFGKTTELTGPLNILQAVQFGEDGMRRVLRSLYTAFDMPDKSDSRIKAYWPRLDETVQAILKQNPASVAAEETSSDGLQRVTKTLSTTWNVAAPRTQESMIEEMLAIVRAMRDSQSVPGWARATDPLSYAERLHELSVRARVWAEKSGIDLVTDEWSVETNEALGEHVFDVVLYVKGGTLPDDWIAARTEDLRRYLGTRSAVIAITY